mgnify:CR=1 FL=1
MLKTNLLLPSFFPKKKPYPLLRISPIFKILKSYDIAQILWGEIPNRFHKSDEESGFEMDLNLVNFKSTVTQLGMVLDKVIFNLDSIDTIVEFKIFGRDYGETNHDLLKGIPNKVPFN